MTFIYTIGLEHTGHHLWHKIANYFDPYQKGLNISQQIFFSEINGNTDKTTDLKLLTSAFLNTIQIAKRLLVFIASCSFPCGDIHQKTRNPNLQFINQAVVNSGANMKYLVLTRAPHEIVYDFNKERLKDLTASCNSIVTQLPLISPSNRLCIPYHDTVKLAPNISRFLGKNITGYIHKAFKSSPKTYNNILSNTQEWAELKSCTTTIARLCHYHKNMKANKQKVS